MEIIFMLLCCFGLTFLLRDAEIFETPRNWLTRNSVFMYKLFDCPFCVGFHAGYIVYLLYVPNWKITHAFLWSLASAATALISYLFLSKLEAK